MPLSWKCRAVVFASRCHPRTLIQKHCKNICTEKAARSKEFRLKIMPSVGWCPGCETKSPADTRLQLYTPPIWTCTSGEQHLFKRAWVSNAKWPAPFSQPFVRSTIVSVLYLWYLSDRLWYNNANEQRRHRLWTNDCSSLTASSEREGGGGSFLIFIRGRGLGAASRTQAYMHVVRPRLCLQ